VSKATASGRAEQKGRTVTTKWPMVRLGEVLAERRDSPRDEDILSEETRIVDKISFDTGKITLRVDGGTRTKLILVQPGDLLVSGINAAKGAIAVYDESETKPIAATIHYGAYVPDKSRVDTNYLWWLLRSGFFRELLSSQVPGGIKTELKAKRLLPVRVPLPPLAEQRRIVARIENLAGQIEDAVALQQRTAFEAESLMVSRLDTLFRQFTRQYETTPLGDVLTEANYGTSEKCESTRSEGAIPVLRIPNVASERVSLESLKYAAWLAKNDRNLLLSPGDILVVRTNGSWDLVGRCAVVQWLPEPMAFASYLIRLRCDTSLVDPSYVQHLLRYLRMSRVLFDSARTTAGQYNVSLGRLRSVKLPIPPLSQQELLISEVDRLQSQINKVRTLQQEISTEFDALLNAILARAFSDGPSVSGSSGAEARKGRGVARELSPA